MTTLHPSPAQVPYVLDRLHKRYGRPVVDSQLSNRLRVLRYPSGAIVRLCVSGRR